MSWVNKYEFPDKLPLSCVWVKTMVECLKSMVRVLLKRKLIYELVAIMYWLEEQEE